MKILKSQSAVLTNFEVSRFIDLESEKRKRENRRQPVATDALAKEVNSRGGLIGYERVLNMQIQLTGIISRYNPISEHSPIHFTRPHTLDTPLTTRILMNQSDILSIV